MPPSTPRNTLSVSSDAGDAARPGAQRHARGQFLLASFGPHQQKVGDVGAGDQQHHSDAPHQHPEHLAQVAHNVVLQRPYGGLYACLFEQL